jgi:hypothetical protein
MDEAAADTSLEGVGAADTLDHSIAYGFTGVLDLFDASGEGDGISAGCNGVIEDQLEGGSLMPDSEAYFALAENGAFDGSAGGEKDIVAADKIAGENGADRITGFGGVGGDGRGEAYPESLSGGELIACQHLAGGAQKQRQQESTTEVKKGLPDGGALHFQR